MRKNLKAPIKWFGGKNQLATKFLEYIPEHTYYLEVFGGSAGLLYAKKPSKFEVYNDLDELLVNFFRVLRDEEKFSKFYQKVCLTPYSRSEYYYCRDKIKETNDDVEKAYMFYVIARMSFSGTFGHGWSHNVTFIRRNMVSTTSAYLSAIELLPEIHERTMTVQIECLDGIECMEKYGSAWNYEDSFIYLDPPYVPKTRRSGKYRYELDTEYHVQLIDYLINNQNRNKYMISGYDNEIYKRLEDNGWKKMSWEYNCWAIGRTRQTGIIGEGSAQGEKQKRIECIWINY